MPPDPVASVQSFVRAELTKRGVPVDVDRSDIRITNAFNRIVSAKYFHPNGTLFNISFQSNSPSSMIEDPRSSAGRFITNGLEKLGIRGRVRTDTIVLTVVSGHIASASYTHSDGKSFLVHFAGGAPVRMTAV